MHQGDLDGVKRLYHINAVECVTQWQMAASVRAISEPHLLSVIEEMLAQFPFESLGFRADNGSKYVKQQVACLLEKLRIEFTRCLPRHSNDTLQQLARDLTDVHAAEELNAASLALLRHIPAPTD